MRRLFFTSLALVLGSCASGPNLGPSPGPASELQPAPAAGLARAPYTPEQIRWSHPEDTFTSMLVQGSGQADAIQEIEWLEVDLAGCTMRSTTFLPDLEQVGEPVVQRASWGELRDHASFPAAATTIVREVILTEAGEFDCWRYETLGPAGLVTRMWFDTATAGAPVAVVLEQDGLEFQRMSLLTHNRRAL